MTRRALTRLQIPHRQVAGVPIREGHVPAVQGRSSRSRLRRSPSMVKPDPCLAECRQLLLRNFGRRRVRILLHDALVGGARLRLTELLEATGQPEQGFGDDGAVLRVGRHHGAIPDDGALQIAIDDLHLAGRLRARVGPGWPGAPRRQRRRRRRARQTARWIANALSDDLPSGSLRSAYSSSVGAGCVARVRASVRTAHSPLHEMRFVSRQIGSPGRGCS